MLRAGAMKLNQIKCCDCVEGMKQLRAGSVPYSLTSPPYDELFIYGGQAAWNFDKFKQVADQLYRITPSGGVVCWIVGEQTKDFSASGTSSRQRVYFHDIGFNLFQTIIPLNHGRITTCRDYYGLFPTQVFVLSKGKPTFVNLLKRKARNPGRIRDDEVRKHCNGQRQSSAANNPRPTPEDVERSVFWEYATGRHVCSEAWLRKEHPALMHEELARNLIESYCPPDAFVFDPMAGCNTSGRMAVLTGRQWLSFEIDPGYVKHAKRRLKGLKRGSNGYLNIDLKGQGKMKTERPGKNYWQCGCGHWTGNRANKCTECGAAKNVVPEKLQPPSELVENGGSDEISVEINGTRLHGDRDFVKEVILEAL